MGLHPSKAQMSLTIFVYDRPYMQFSSAYTVTIICDKITLQLQWNYGFISGIRDIKKISETNILFK